MVERPALPKISSWRGGGARRLLQYRKEVTVVKVRTKIGHSNQPHNLFDANAATTPSTGQRYASIAPQRAPRAELLLGSSSNPLRRAAGGDARADHRNVRPTACHKRVPDDLELPVGPDRGDLYKQANGGRVRS